MQKKNRTFVIHLNLMLEKSGIGFGHYRLRLLRRLRHHHYQHCPQRYHHSFRIYLHHFWFQRRFLHRNHLIFGRNSKKIFLVWCFRDHNYNFHLITVHTTENKSETKTRKMWHTQPNTIPGIGDGCRLPLDRLDDASSAFPDTNASNGSADPDNGSPFSSAASVASTSFERRYISFRMLQTIDEKKMRRNTWTHAEFNSILWRKIQIKFEYWANETKKPTKLTSIWRFSVCKNNFICSDMFESMNLFVNDAKQQWVIRRWMAPIFASCFMKAVSFASDDIFMVFMLVAMRSMPVIQCNYIYHIH